MNIVKNNEYLGFSERLSLNVISSLIKSCKACIWVTLSIVNVANAAPITNNIDDQKQSVNSLPVVYESLANRQATSRIDKEMNEAQQQSLNAIKQLDVLVSTERINRQQVIAQRTKKPQSATDTLTSNYAQSTSSAEYLEFEIYSAFIRLFEDFDYDGYFQTFSVSFDADIKSYHAGKSARVYADLYLRRNNGPWELYFTTEPFNIVDDNSDDEFEVLTTLNLGYKTAHYDVLIDLYEVGYGDIVATISSEDLDALYAVPLESADRDTYYVDDPHTTNVVVRGGSFSHWAVLMLTGIVGWRLYKLR